MRKQILLSIMVASSASAGELPACEKWAATSKVGQKVIMTCQATGETVVIDDNSSLGACTVNYPEIVCQLPQATPVAAAAAVVTPKATPAIDSIAASSLINEIRQKLAESKARRSAQQAEAAEAEAASNTETAAAEAIKAAATEAIKNAAAVRAEHAEQEAKQVAKITAAAVALPPEVSVKTPEKEVVELRALKSLAAPARVDDQSDEPEYGRLEPIPNRNKTSGKNASHQNWAEASDEVLVRQAEPIALEEVRETIPQAAGEQLSAAAPAGDEQKEDKTQTSLVPLLLFGKTNAAAAIEKAAIYQPTAAVVQANVAQPTVIQPAAVQPAAVQSAAVQPAAAPPAAITITTANVQPAPAPERPITVAAGSGILLATVNAPKLAGFRFYIPAGEEQAILDLPAVNAPVKPYTIKIGKGGIKSATVIPASGSARVIFTPQGATMPRLTPVVSDEKLHLAVDMSSKVPARTSQPAPVAASNGTASKEQLDDLRRTLQLKGVALDGEEWQGVLVAASEKQIIMAARAELSPKLEKQIGTALKAKISDGEIRYYIVDSGILR